MHIKTHLLTILITIGIFSSQASFCDEKALIPQTIELSIPFGYEETPSELVKELLTNSALIRLKEIDQSGITRYTQDLPSFSRYEHSIGVYMLLRRYGLSEKECIAGLLHDVSHTVFSHVGDLLFKDDGERIDYHDRIYLWYLKQHGIDQILEKYGLTVEEIDPSNEAFTALEQDLPNMCADRIQYTLNTGYLFGQICICEIDSILQDLVYEAPHWYFTSIETARYFANLSLYFSENLWANPQDMLGYHWCAEAMKLAIENKEISISDILFSTDLTVLTALQNSSSPEIQNLMKKCYHPFEKSKQSNKEDNAFFLKTKFRGIDPLVLHEGHLTPLTTIDSEFASKYYTLKNVVESGYYFKIDH